MDTSPAHERNDQLTQAGFDRLLSWLHPDREAAGSIYENIRLTLIKRFHAHGCSSAAEDLADETVNRVAIKLAEIMSTYVGDPARYFYRVAYYVHLEHLRKDIGAVDLPEDLRHIEAEVIEPEYECLERCIEHLPARSRELVLKYYQGEKGIKIKFRKELASSLKIKLPTLRLQAQRIRMNLKKCILECLKQKAIC